MFDIGWPEFLVILVVALLVVGPRDLPGALRQVGRWVRSARKMAREFQRHVDDAMREAELDDLKKGIDATRSLSVKRQIEKLVDPDDELSDVDGGRAATKARRAKPQAARTAADADRPATQQPAAPPSLEKADGAALPLGAADPDRSASAEALPEGGPAVPDEVRAVTDEVRAVTDGGGGRP